MEKSVIDLQKELDAANAARADAIRIADAANERIAQLEEYKATGMAAQLHETIVEADQLRERIRALEAAPPTSEEVKRAASLLDSGAYGDVSDITNLLRRLDRERQEQDQRYISAVNGRREFRQAMVEWKQRAETAEAALAEARKDVDALKSVIAAVMAIPTMTDQQLTELQANCRAAIAREGQTK